MVGKEGDTAGIESIRERLDLDDKLAKKVMSLHGIPKVLLRNSVQSDSIEKNIYWLAYIHHNPIHHEYCKDYSQWKYSSYNTYLTTKNTKLNRSQTLDKWFSSLDDFLQYHSNFKLDHNIDQIDQQIDH